MVKVPTQSYMYFFKGDGMNQWIKRCLALSIAGLMLAGCSQTYLTGFRTESHFAYPNSNISPLGYAKGESSPACGLSVSFVNSGMQEEAVRNALQAKQGDILVNYLEFTTLTNILFFSCTSYSVEGTAAKMVVGTQKLK